MKTPIAIAFLLLAALSTASAQTVYRGPAGVTGGAGYTGAAGTLAGPGGSVSGAPAVSAPNLTGILPATAAPTVVQRQIIDPPRAAAAGAPDGGGTSECDCYRIVNVPIMGPQGQISWTSRREPTGQRLQACCPR